MTLRLSDVTALLDGWYDPDWAADWDAVGLVCGDPDQPVARVLLAVDPAPAVVDEAARVGRRPRRVPPPAAAHARCTVSRRPPPRAACCTGFSDRAPRCSPRTPTPTSPPTGSTSRWPGPWGSSTRGSWRPTTLADGGADGGAAPGRRARPAATDGSAGSPRPRRCGTSQPGSTRRCPRPRTASGWRATPGGPWRRSWSAAAPATSCSTPCSARDADVYLTSDLRHHRAGEFLEHGGPALVDVAHWAAEWTWLPVVERKLRDGRRGAGGYGGDPGERHRHRPVDLPGRPLTRRGTDRPTAIEENTLKADASPS